MKKMKKLSTYFFATVFLLAFYPKQCDWPNPDEDMPQKKTVQLTPQSTIDINSIDLSKKIT